MIPRKLYILLVFIVLVGCNQTDTNTQSTSNEQENVQNDSNNTGTVPERTGKVLARVNGSPIYEDDLKGKTLDAVITDEIIYQVGLKQGLDSEIQDKVNQYQRVLVVGREKDKMLENAPPTKDVSDEQIQQYYDMNKDRYTYFRIHEITFPNANIGIEIKDKAEKGEDLQDIANSYPDQAVTVTDIGFNRSMIQKFNTKEVGSISEVIQKPNGTFSVLKIVDTKDIPLSTSKKSIRNSLEAKSQARFVDSQAKQAAKENNIEIEIVNQ